MEYEGRKEGREGKEEKRWLIWRMAGNEGEKEQMGHIENKCKMVDLNLISLIIILTIPLKSKDF